MFAGLPGIGVGTLYYVLIAFWMPVRELAFVARGQSSWARWRLIGLQLVFAAGILASVAAADRLLFWVLGGGSSQALGPARWLNDELGAHAPSSILAAPITASLLLLATVLVAVQLARVLVREPGRRPARLDLKAQKREVAAREGPSSTAQLNELGFIGYVGERPDQQIHSQEGA